MKIIFTTAIIAMVAFGLAYGMDQMVIDCMQTKGKAYYVTLPGSCEASDAACLDQMFFGPQKDNEFVVHCVGEVGKDIDKVYLCLEEECKKLAP